jgi:hypothetical protein
MELPVAINIVSERRPTTLHLRLHTVPVPVPVPVPVRPTRRILVLPHTVGRITLARANSVQYIYSGSYSDEHNLYK